MIDAHVFLGDSLLEMNDAVNESSTGILTEDEIKDYEKRYIEILEAGKDECPEISTKTGVVHFAKFGLAYKSLPITL